jgi:uncharacterized membrane protein YoaK (UPF0700 family)
MAESESRMSWMPLRHWLLSYFGGLAVGAVAWLYSAQFWFSIGAMVAFIVAYVFILSVRLRPARGAKPKAPVVNTRQARRAAARRADKEFRG